MQVHIKPYIKNIENILSMLGYSLTASGYELKSDFPFKEENLITTACHCFLGYIECTCLADIAEEVKLHGIKPLKVVELRKSFTGSKRASVNELIRNLEQNSQLDLDYDLYSKHPDQCIGDEITGARPKKQSSAASRLKGTDERAIEKKTVSSKHDISNEDTAYFGYFDDHLKESLSMLDIERTSEIKSRSPIHMSSFELIDDDIYGASSSSSRKVRANHRDPSDPILITTNHNNHRHQRPKREPESASHISAHSEISQFRNEKSTSHRSTSQTPIFLQTSVTTDCAVSPHRSISPVNRHDLQKERYENADNQFVNLPPYAIHQNSDSKFASKTRTDPEQSKGLYQNYRRESIYDNIPNISEDASLIHVDVSQTSNIAKYSKDGNHHGKDKGDTCNSDLKNSSDASTRHKFLQLEDTDYKESDLPRSIDDNLYRSVEGHQNSFTKSKEQDENITWICEMCTLMNPENVDTCNACTTKRKSYNSNPLPSGNIVCPACTAFNNPDRLTCYTCDFSLKIKYSRV